MLKKLRKTGTETSLELTVLETVNYMSADYGSGVAGFMGDLMRGGCESGMIGELIYYSDTTAFYKKYEKEIDALLAESMESCGLDSPKELFGNKWDNDDPLAKDDFNQNLLTWFAFEETARNLAMRQGVEV